MFLVDLILCLLSVFMVFPSFFLKRGCSWDYLGCCMGFLKNKKPNGVDNATKLLVYKKKVCRAKAFLEIDPNIKFS